MSPPPGRPKEGSLPLGGSEIRGSKPACAGLDGPSAWRVTRQATRSAKGAP